MRCCTPVACDLGVFDPDQRKEHDALLARIVSEARRRDATEDGARLVYALEPEQSARVARFAALEVRCCPFLRFEVAIADGELALVVHGPPEAQPIVREAFAV
jgi:hypothetical protein